MDRATFAQTLDSATIQATEFARPFVRQELTAHIAYRVYPNQSCDDHSPVGDEVRFPEDSLPTCHDYHGPWLAQHVVAFLWRRERVPEWIDISVEAIDRDHTLMSLLCSGTYTAEAQRLRYKHGLPPFGIKGPIFPPAWESRELSGPFDLAWHECQQGPRPAPRQPSTADFLEAVKRIAGAEIH